MRLIDADAHEVFLTEQALRYNGENFTDKCMNTAYRLAIDAVHNAPTVDAVPVVRCKDCRYHSTYVCRNDFTGISHRCDCGVPTYDDDFFCANGERMAEE